MHAELTVNGSTSAAARYVGWAPVPAQVRLANSAGAAGPVAVTLRNQNTAKGGQVVFYAAIPGTGQATLSLTLPVAGAPVNFFIAGQWQRPSTEDRDATVEVVESATKRILGSIPLMVRIRKDAMTLTTGERDRFRNAFAAFNILGLYNDFRDAHNRASDAEMHGNAGFLHWHRAFLLDLERELQRIDPSVTIPYWQWDRPAPSVFSLDFMGVTNPVTHTVRFSWTNPLQFWATEGVPGILREPLFDTQTEPAKPIEGFTKQLGILLTEVETLNLGEPGALYSRFRRMEGNPHGGPHASFSPGFLLDPATSPRDPLFFLLHSNVDRLWAKWQWIKRRFDVNSTSTFEPADPPRVGHRLKDTMWPWNGVTGDPRPSTAPGGTLAPSLLTNAPGPRPRLCDVIDYQGVHTSADRLGFDYDDVPFQFA